MTRPHGQAVAVAAIVVLLLSVGVVWQVATVRESQAMDAEKAALIDAQVDVRQSPTDYDGDGVADRRDECPTRPETDNGFEDDDGCPDIVTTTGAS